MTTEQVDSNVYMVLSATKKDGFLKASSCFLIFSQDKIIVAILSKEMQNSESRKMQEQIKAEGKGFFKGAAAMMNFWSNFSNRYYDLSPEEILQEESSNFMIINNEVEKIVFKPADRNDNSGKSLGELVIFAQNNTIKTTHQYSDGNKNIKKVLESLYGKRLKYKGGFSIQVGGNKEGFQ
ncbi:MAG: hypothetical protein NUK65_09155 [Firmicutes bacterium]|nr:hypothetical protein [Bacillota bacterium]